MSKTNIRKHRNDEIVTWKMKRHGEIKQKSTVYNFPGIRLIIVPLIDFVQISDSEVRLQHYFHDGTKPN